jgi:putative aldouronate transport system permease protein
MDFLNQCRKHWQLFLFIMPAAVYILVFSYYPMFGVQIAFKDFTPGKGIWGSPWVGFKHFVRFFHSYQFSRVVLNTLRLSFYGLLVGTPLAICMSLAINVVRNMHFKKIVQTITYMPHFISVVVLVGMIIQAFNPIMGMYGNIYRMLGGTGYPKDLLTKASVFPHLYVWSGIWQGLGWSTIIYLAALANVDLEQHEAAQIEGATRFKRIIYIDFPVLLPTASILLILRAGSIMSVGFEKVFLMQNSANLVLSEVISTYVYQVGMSGGGTQFSYASAIGLFNSIINCVILIVVNFFSRRVEEGASLF